MIDLRLGDCVEVMKTITFKELIELIELGKSPKTIYVAGIQFSWNGYKYTSYGGVDLEFKMQYNDLFNTTIKIPTKPLLTDEERAYLKAVIEPVKEDVFSIRRQSGTLYIHISVTATMTFNLKTFIYKFSGLKDQKSYTLKDLDLE